MDRLRSPRFLIFMAFGILATITVLPTTNWAVKNAIDELRYGTVEGIPGAPRLRLPKNITDADLLSSQDPDTAMTRAILKGDAQAAMRCALDHPAPPNWASALRVCYGQTPQNGRSPTLEANWARNHPKEAALEALEEVQRERATLQAAKGGHAADPDNAFFSLAMAQVLWETHDRVGSERALSEAAASTNYDDYLTEQPELINRVVEARWGYRGEARRLATQAGLPAWDLGYYRKFAMSVNELPRDKHGLEVRWLIFRVASILGEKGSEVLHFLIARDMCRAVTMEPNYRFSRSEAEQNTFFLLRVKEFAQELKDHKVNTGSQDPLEIWDRLSAFRASFFQTEASSSSLEGDVLRGKGFQHPIELLLATLACLLAWVPVSGLVANRGKRATDAILPYALAEPAVVVAGGLCGAMPGAVKALLGLTAVAAIVSVLLRSHPIEAWIKGGYLVVLVSLGMAFGPVVAVPAVLFGVAWFMSVRPVSYGVRMVAIACVMVVAMGLMVPVVWQLDDCSIGGLAVLYVVALFPRTGIEHPRETAAFTVLTMSLVVLFLVADQVRFDRQLAQFRAVLTKEAEVIRTKP